MKKRVPEVYTESAENKFCLICGKEGMRTGSVHHQNRPYRYGCCDLFHIGEYERIEIYRENVKYRLGLITETEYLVQRERLLQEPDFLEYCRAMGLDPNRAMNDQCPADPEKSC